MFLNYFGGLLKTLNTAIILLSLSFLRPRKVCRKNKTNLVDLISMSENKKKNVFPENKNYKSAEIKI